MLSVDSVNAYGYEEFIRLFGNVIEHCPVIAAAIWKKKPFSSAQQIHEYVCQTIDGFSVEVQCGILRCHPDLAGRLATTGGLSVESTNEQRLAGLLGATDEERGALDASNTKYRARFGFPFVVCVRENKKEAIMRGIVERLENSVEEEINKGIGEVKKIGWIRICDIMDNTAKL